MIEGLVRLMGAACGPAPVNIGNPLELTILKLAESVQEPTRNRRGLSSHPLPKDDPRRRQPDLTVARKRIGFEASASIDLGLERTVEWMRVAARPASPGAHRSAREE